MSYSGDLAHEIIEVCKQTGKYVYVLENFAYKPLIQKMKEQVNNGYVGKPIYCDMRQHYVLDYNKDPSDVFAKTSWRIEPEFSLGCFMDGGVHYLSAMTQIFGRPDSLFATGSGQRDDYGEYDHILTLFDYPDSLRVSFSQSGILDGDREALKIWGTEGYISYEKNHIAAFKNGVSEDIDVLQTESHLAMWQYLAKCVTENTPPLYSVEEAALSIEICDAVSRSLKEHKLVNI